MITPHHKKYQSNSHTCHILFNICYIFHFLTNQQDVLFCELKEKRKQNVRNKEK